jgi:hypothetical protein
LILAYVANLCFFAYLPVNYLSPQPLLNTKSHPPRLGSEISSVGVGKFPTSIGRNLERSVVTTGNIPPSSFAFYDVKEKRVHTEDPEIPTP